MDNYTLKVEVTKAMITWLLELIPEDMIKNHEDPEYKYKKVKLEFIYDTCIASFEAQHEDVQAVNMDLQAVWDPTAGLQKMMNQVQTSLRGIAEMKGQAMYTTEYFIKKAYLKIAGSHQFVKQCDKWNHKPAAEKATEAQFREYFTKEYKLWCRSQKSLQQLGIRNAVQSQKKMQNLARQVEEANEKSAMALSLASMKQEEEVTTATANSTISSIINAITAAAQNSQQSKDDWVAKQLQTLIDLIKNQENKENNNQGNNDKDKRNDYYPAWKITPPTTADQTMDTPDGKVY